ncbi:MAG: peptidoglycan editing factor PgeF [Chloroflexota bacterium]
MAASSQPDLPLYQFRSFREISGIVHGVTLRHGGVSRGSYGSLNLSLSVDDDEAAVHENKARVAAAFRSTPEALITSRQVHGNTVVAVSTDAWPANDPPRADALITNRPGTLLLQRFADCVPILLADRAERAIGLAHAGWRGTVQNVAGATVAALEASYETRATELAAAIGPSIGPCCFEVDNNVAEQFRDVPGVITQGSRKLHVNLWEANRVALVSAGLPPEAIEVAEICTRCHSNDYFSHRALGYPAGRFGAVIGLAS